MKNVRMVCFLVLACVFMSGALFAAETAQPLDVKLNVISGQVKLIRDGKPVGELFTSTFPVFEKDIIETQLETKAELNYSDGTVMRMKPLTKVEVRATSLMVCKGQTWFKFTKRGTEFIIETPSLVAGIRGTVFDITVNPRDKTILSVMEGAVAVRGSKGKEITVESGFATACQPNSRPSTPIHFNLEKKNSQWDDADWAYAGNDFDQLFAYYSKLSSLYGENDSRTVEAKKRAENAKHGKNRKK